MNEEQIPVITVDGPSGTGKGTISRQLAHQLGFHFLDSGALYRLLGLAARHHAIPLEDEAALETLAAHLDARFVSDEELDDTQVLLEGEIVTEAIRSVEAGRDASIVAAVPGVRRALLDRQRAFRQQPGLVADGRDMGTVVFPRAVLKIYLEATLEERARRRYKQLRQKGIDVRLEPLLAELERRDARDSSRAVAPMRPADDAIVVDTTQMDIAAVLARVEALWTERS